MNNRDLFLLGLSAVTTFSASAQKQKESLQLQSQIPNVVLIIADQWRGDALGCVGKEPVKTPNLDRLASAGIRFDNAVSCYPVSSPARAILMTGFYPIKNHVTGNCNSSNAPFGVELPQSARCWSDILSELGFDLGYVGKWHLDSPYKPYVNTSNNKGSVAWNEFCPENRRHGFAFWEAYGTYDNHMRPMYWSNGDSRESFHYVDDWGPHYEATRAIEYLQKHANGSKPFALVVSMNPPHTGYDLVPDRYKEVYKNLDVESLIAGRPDIPPRGTKSGDIYRKCLPDYYACMTGVDDNVGRIMDELKRLGIENNTIVIFSSDHGALMGDHEIEGKNIYYDTAMRVPLIIRWPSHLKPRVDKQTQISFGDIYPTLFSLMGLQNKIPSDVQTKDFGILAQRQG